MVKSLFTWSQSTERDTDSESLEWSLHSHHFYYWTTPNIEHEVLSDIETENKAYLFSHKVGAQLSEDT